MKYNKEEKKYNKGKERIQHLPTREKEINKKKQKEREEGEKSRTAIFQFTQKASSSFFTYFCSNNLN